MLFLIRLFSRLSEERGVQVLQLASEHHLRAERLEEVDRVRDRRPRQHRDPRLRGDWRLHQVQAPFNSLKNFGEFLPLAFGFARLVVA